MRFIELAIQGLLEIEPDVFADERGFFLERYSKKKFAAAGIDADFVQDNHSRSAKGILRGLHFQKPPHAQDKLVWVTSGEVYDVAVDLRRDSLTYGKWHGVILSEANKKMFFMPKGFAHGFVVLSASADFLYKVSDFFAPETDGGIIWNDPDLAISWPEKEPVLSAKDDQHPFFRDLDSPF